MKSQPKKKNRFMAFLSSLCSAKPNTDRNESRDKKKCKFKVQKVPRLTFQLDRVLVKLSRKNVAEEEFMENQVLTYHLEKYLVGRLKECDIVVFSGQFSNFLMQKIPYSIEIKSTKQEAFESQNNYLLSNQQGQINLRMQAIDALVFQLYFGENENSCKKSENSDRTEETNQQSEVNEQVDKIQAILRFYQKKVNSFVFICHKNLKLEDIHGLFLVFREKYMFEFEKVRKIKKTACNIIYVSTKTKFLRIDDLSLCDFFITELKKMKGFDDEKERNKTQEILKFHQMKDKNAIKEKSISPGSKKGPNNMNSEEKMFTLKELSKRQSFQTLVLKMFEKNLNLQMSQALATIVQFPEKKSNKINWFLELMHQRYPDCREIVEKYRNKPQQQKQEEFTKTCSQFTPLFAQRSNNFSKMTALFRTHSSKDEDDFIFCKGEENEEMEF